MLGLHRDIVKLEPHQTEWEEAFAEEKKILKDIMGDLALSIEHVGSTALPIAAKPIIDIAVTVEKPEILEFLLGKLAALGYDMKDSRDTIGEILAAKGSPENRTHYIHIIKHDKEFGNLQVLFRDYLLNHRDKLEEYAFLKNNLYKEFKDERKKYTAAKNDFIVNTLELAKAEHLKTKRQKN